MNNLIVTVDSIKGETIRDVVNELRDREDTKHLSYDLQEAIAIHLVVTDTDWSSSDKSGSHYEGDF